ncbi:hypothetical protein GZH53_07600 [Flavihumibacter sp. R14]|nr:hypothetical protein [Flavihumibacter soli]
MTTEFTYPPVSGQFEEKPFDLNTVWKSSEWSWVKFSSDMEEWYGSFRGTAIKVATATQLGLAAVLTSDCFYIINPFDREVAFFDPQTMIQQLASDSNGSKFIVADWYTLKYIEADLIFKEIPSHIECDNIEFGKVLDNKLQLNFEEIPDYQIRNGLLDLKTWDLQII